MRSIISRTIAEIGAFVIRSYEDSLQRPGIDTVDALLIHDLDAGYHGEDGVKAIPGPNAPGQVRTDLAWMHQPVPAELWAELRREGLIRADAPTPAV